MYWVRFILWTDGPMGILLDGLIASRKESLDSYSEAVNLTAGIRGLGSLGAVQFTIDYVDFYLILFYLPPSPL